MGWLGEAEQKPFLFCIMNVNLDLFVEKSHLLDGGKVMGDLKLFSAFQLRFVQSSRENLIDDQFEKLFSFLRECVVLADCFSRGSCVDGVT